MSQQSQRFHVGHRNMLGISQKLIPKVMQCNIWINFRKSAIAVNLQNYCIKTKFKSSLYPKSVTSGGTNLRGLVTRQQSSEETSQRCEDINVTVFDLTDTEFEPKTSRTDSNVLNNRAH